MAKKRKLPATDSEPASLDEFAGGHGLENVTWRDVAWTASEAAEKRAERLERRLILDRIIMAIVKAHPRKEKKKGLEPLLNRVRQVRSELLGEPLRAGRPPQVKDKLLDAIAVRYFQSYFKNGMREPPLDRILKEVLAPDRRKLKQTEREVENIIKRYRVAFRAERDWLILRNIDWLDVPHQPSITEQKTITYLLGLTGKKNASTSI